MKKKYVQPLTKVVAFYSKSMMLQASEKVRFSDQRPTNGITNGAYATDGLDYGSARSREINWFDD